MKKIMIFILMIAFIFLLIPNKNKVNAESSVTPTADQLENIGLGYNAYAGKALYEQDAFCSGHILDQDKLKTDAVLKKATISTVNASGKTIYEFSSSAQEFSEKMSNKTSANINSTATIKIIKTTIDLDMMFERSETISGKQYEEYQVWGYIENSRTVSLNLYSIDEARTLLDDSFLNNALTIKTDDDAKKFMDMFGTHLFTGLTYGGMLTINSYLTSTSSSISEETTIETRLSAQVSETSNSIAAGGNASFEGNYSSQLDKETAMLTYNVTRTGGIPFEMLRIEDIFTWREAIANGYKAGYVYAQWLESINKGENLAAMDIANGAPVYTVWDLLPNTEDYALAKTKLAKVYYECCDETYENYLNAYPNVITSSVDTSISKTYEFLGYTYTSPSGAVAFTPEEEVMNNEITIYTTADSSISKVELSYYADDRTKWEITTKNSTELIGCKSDENEIESGIFKFEQNSIGHTYILKLKTFDGEVIHSMSIVVRKQEHKLTGSGTQSDPYLIVNKIDFNNFILDNTYWQSNTYVKLCCDIDMKGDSIDGVDNFKGNFDGQGCSVYNFKLVNTSFNNEGSTVRIGLFNKIEGTVNNLIVGKTNYNTYIDFAKDKIPSGDITAYIGALCGELGEKGNINRCKVISFGKSLSDIRAASDENYSNEDDRLAKMLKTMKDNCDITINKGKCKAYAGLIAGYAKGGNIYYTMVDDSKMSMNVDKTGDNYVGGILGMTEDISTTIKYAVVKSSYLYIYTKTNTGGYSYVGGAVGGVCLNSNAELKNIVVYGMKIIDYEVDSSNGNKGRGMLVGRYMDINNYLNFYYEKGTGYEAPSNGFGITKDNKSVTTKAFDDNELNFTSLAYDLQKEFYNDNDKIAIKVSNENNLIIDYDLITVYYQKDQEFRMFDLKSIMVQAAGSDPQKIKYFMVDTSNVNSSAIGDYKVKIKYLNATKEITIHVVDTLCQYITTNINKDYKNYYKDSYVKKDNEDVFEEYLNYKDFLTVKMVDVNGISHNLNLANCKIEQETNNLGVNRIKVTYKGVNNIEYYSYGIVQLYENKVKSLNVTQAYSVNVNVGDTYPFENITISAEYTDGTSKTIKVTDCEVIGACAKKGENELKIIYDDFVSASITYNGIGKEMTGIYIKTNPTKTVYEDEEKLNLDGLEVYAVYSDLSESKVKIEDLAISYNSFVVGENTINISLNGFVASFTITYSLTAPIISSIYVSKQPKTIYFTGESLDVTGLEVTGILTDESEIVLDSNEYSVSPTELVEGNNIIYISYKNLQTSFTVVLYGNSIVTTYKNQVDELVKMDDLEDIFTKVQEIKELRATINDVFENDVKDTDKKFNDFISEMNDVIKGINQDKKEAQNVSFNALVSIMSVTAAGLILALLIKRLY